MTTTQKTTPCLWFDGQAEQAATFYTGIFENSRILEVSRYPAESPGEEGAAMTVLFELDGMRYLGLNGGPQYTFSEAISFQIDCGSQDEVDHFWTALSDGGEEGPCGWLKDRFGVSWQVVPNRLPELLGDPEHSQAVMQAMFGMKKIVIADLEAAAQ